MWVSWRAGQDIQGIICQEGWVFEKHGQWTVGDLHHHFPSPGIHGMVFISDLPSGSRLVPIFVASAPVCRPRRLENTVYLPIISIQFPAHQWIFDLNEVYIIFIGLNLSVPIFNGLQSGRSLYTKLRFSRSELIDRRLTCSCAICVTTASIQRRSFPLCLSKQTRAAVYAGVYGSKAVSRALSSLELETPTLCTP
jgi:hypothetical protein